MQIVCLKAQVIVDSIQTQYPSTLIPANDFSCISADSLNNLYLGGDNGLFKWENNKWYNYRAGITYRDFCVRDMVIDKQNNVWTRSTSQLFKFSDGIFTRINAVDEGCYGLIYMDSNYIFSSDFEKVHKININTHEHITYPLASEDLMSNIKADKNRVIWGKGGFSNLIYEFRNDSIRMHKHLNGINYTDIIDYTFIDSTYYALLTYQGIKQYEDGAYTTIEFPINNDFYCYFFNYLSDSSIILCSMNYGVYKFKDNNWIRVDDPQDKFYAPRKVYEFGKDSLGIIYEDDGLSIITKKGSTTYKGPAIDNIRRLKHFNNTLFIGSNKGHISQWDGSNIENMGEDPPFFGCLQLYSKEEELYTTNLRGVYSYHYKQWKSLNEKYHLPDTFYYTSQIDSNKTLYAGSNNGLIIADTTEVQKILLSGNTIWTNLLDSKGRLWISAHKGDPYFGDLYLYKNGELKKQNIPNSYGTPVFLFEDSKGNIWSGSIFVAEDYFSLNMFDGQKWHNIRFENINGWNHIGVKDICEDKWGNIYLASNRIFRYNGSDWESYDTNIGLPFTGYDGLTTDNIGNLYIGTTSFGTYVLHFEDTAHTSTPQALKLENIKAYPNPAKNILNYDLQTQERCVISIYNTLGQMVLNKQNMASSGTINTEQLKPGQYVLQIVGEKSFGTANFVVE